MRKLILCCLLGCLLPVSLTAQVAYMEEKAKVNKIKRSSQYLYGEGVAATVEEATAMAETSLKNAILAEMGDNKELQGADQILINSIKKHSEKIQLKRGAMERVFLFVEKKNLLSSEKVVVLDVASSTVAAQPAVAPAPEVKQEVAVQPVEPKKSVKKNTTQKASTVTDEVNLEAMAAEPVEAPAPKQSNVFTPVSGQVLSLGSPVAVDSPLLKELLALKGSAELEQFMRARKDEHKLMWGNVKSSVNPAWYVVVFSDTAIKAVFDKEKNGARVNLLNGKSENLSQYAADNKVWFILYE